MSWESLSWKYSCVDTQWTWQLTPSLSICANWRAERSSNSVSPVNMHPIKQPSGLRIRLTWRKEQRRIWWRELGETHFSECSRKIIDPFVEAATTRWEIGKIRFVLTNLLSRGGNMTPPTSCVDNSGSTFSYCDLVYCNQTTSFVARMWTKL